MLRYGLSLTKTISRSSVNRSTSTNKSMIQKTCISRIVVPKRNYPYYVRLFYNISPSKSQQSIKFDDRYLYEMETPGKVNNNKIEDEKFDDRYLYEMETLETTGYHDKL